MSEALQDLPEPLRGKLRRALQYLGLRDDKPAREVVREEPVR